MGAFEYTAVDPTGRERKGVLEGDTARAGAAAAARPEPAAGHRQRSRADREASRTQAQFSLRRGVSAGDLSLLTRQIATLVHSGLPLEEALLAVVGTDREAAHPQHHHGRARQGDGRPRARRRPGGFPGACFRSCIARRSRPASSRAISTPCSSGWRTTPRAASSCAAARMNAMLYPVLLFVVCVGDRVHAADVRRAEDRQAVRELQGASCRSSRKV